MDVILLAVPLTAACLVVCVWLISRLVTTTVEGVTRMMGQVVSEILHPTPAEPTSEVSEQEQMYDTGQPAWANWPSVSPE